jgi:hypothetical protein
MDLFPPVRLAGMAHYLEPAIIVPGGSKLRVVFQNVTAGIITNVWVLLHGYYRPRRAS